jgi:hypothetical protein
MGTDGARFTSTREDDGPRGLPLRRLVRSLLSLLVQAAAAAAEEEEEEPRTAVSMKFALFMRKRWGRPACDSASTPPSPRRA